MANTIHNDRRRFVRAAATALAGASLGYLFRPLPVKLATAAQIAGDELTSLARATAWLNSPPLTAASLRSKIVLVDFWTYTCINWMRTLPYVRAWVERYAPHGLVVIGVHSPEFPFEQDLDNVRGASKDLRVEYPIAIDNDFAIWRAFDNSYWPALYLLDGDSRIQFRHFGEGNYDRTESAIQKLLREANSAHRAIATELVPVEGSGVEASADWSNLKSPEAYLGYGRAERFASPGGAITDEAHFYAAPERLRLNRWALSGEWTVKRGSIVLNRRNGMIRFSFHARDLHLVMGPSVRGAAIKFRVTLNGEPPGAAAGGDIDAAGSGTLNQQRMYQLIRQPRPIQDREFAIEFLADGAEAFSFTFG